MDHYIIRKHYRNGYKYYNKRGNEIKCDKKLIDYISQNYIPPAYKDVHINLRVREDIYAIGTASETLLDVYYKTNKKVLIIKTSLFSNLLGYKVCNHSFFDKIISEML